MPKISEIKVVRSPWRPISEADRRRAALVVANLISRLDFVTDWRLQKAYFLAEVWSIEERLRRLSAVDFASWAHGPWSLHVREAEEALEAQEIVSRVRHPAKRRPEAEFLQIKKAEKLPPLEESDSEFLDSFAAQVKFVDGEKLTKITKLTLPFQATRRDALVNLDRYLQTLREKHERFVNSPRVARLVAEAKAE